jgi:penicillin-insensitive murein endopeptidase
MRSRRLYALAVSYAVGAAGCAELGVIDDGRALSRGATNGGTVLHPIQLPAEGDGYWVPPLWRARGHEYGSEGAIDLVVGVARRIAGPGAPRLGVGDISPLVGGESAEHHSHQAGRDIDLLFFVTTPDGTPIENDAMRKFGPDGLTRVERGEPGLPRRRFDLARNWALVRALVTAPEADVQWVFLSEPLSLALLDYARAHGESDALVARARAVLHQPGDSAPHDDHMHVRIFCSPADRAAGCIDHGPPPADDPPPRDDAAALAARALARFPRAALAGR